MKPLFEGLTESERQRSVTQPLPSNAAQADANEEAQESATAVVGPRKAAAAGPLESPGSLRASVTSPNTLSLCRNPNEDSEFRAALTRRWMANRGSDMLVFVGCSSMEDARRESNDLPLNFFDHNSSVCLRLHSFVVCSVCPVLNEVYESLRLQNGGVRSPQSLRTRERGLPKGVKFFPDIVQLGLGSISETAVCVSIDTAHIEGGAFLRAMRYVYSGELRLSDSNVSETLRACHYLKLRGGVELCSDYLLEKLHPCNALSICALANLFDCGRLEELADDYLSENFQRVTDEIEWRELNSKAVERLLQRDNLVCDSEASVVEALLKWTKGGGSKEYEREDSTSPSANQRKRKRTHQDRETSDKNNNDSNESRRDGEEDRTAAFKRMLNNGSVRLAHLSDEELEKLTTVMLYNSDELCAIWKEATQGEIERRATGDGDGDGDVNMQEDVEEYQVPNMRRYSTARGFKVDKDHCKTCFEGHTSYVYAVTEAPTGEIVSGSRDQTIRLWREEGEISLQGHQERVFGLLTLSNGKIASCSFDHTIMIWTPKDWTCERVLTDHESWVVALAEVAGRLVSGAADNTLKVWNLDTFACERTLRGHENHVYGVCCVKLVRGGNEIEILASGSQDKTAKLWDPQNDWTLMNTLEGHRGSIRSIKQIGDFLATASEDRTVRVWHLTTEPLGRSAGKLIGHSDVVESLACVFTPKSTIPACASASRDSTIKIWDVISRTCIMTLVGHTSWVKSLYVLSSGELASASADKTVRVWDLSTL